MLFNHIYIVIYNEILQAVPQFGPQVSSVTFIRILVSTSFFYMYCSYMDCTYVCIFENTFRKFEVGPGYSFGDMNDD